MSIAVARFDAAHYGQARVLWEQCEGIRLHDDCDSYEAIAAYLERNPGLSFVALEDGEMVGAVLCGHDGRRGYIHHLAVAPRARGKGIGRMLVERGLAQLRELGISRCHIFIVNDNAEGIRFWERIGWRRRADVSIMSRDL
jgi:ribosomal protein S18 acetylase RimI-like enzyme